MTAAEGFAGSAPDAVLDALTAAMGIENRIGALEEARAGAPPRITWVPPERGGIGTASAPFGLVDRDVVELQTLTFDVHIYASSYTELASLHVQLAAQLDVLAGPKMGNAFASPPRPGYEFGKPSSVGPVQNAEVAGAWACICPAVLKDFIDRRKLITAPIHAPSPVTIVTTALDGTAEQQAIP